MSNCFIHWKRCQKSPVNIIFLGFPADEDDENFARAEDEAASEGDEKPRCRSSENGGPNKPEERAEDQGNEKGSVQTPGENRKTEAAERLTLKSDRKDN